MKFRICVTQFHTQVTFFTRGRLFLKKYTTVANALTVSRLDFRLRRQMPEDRGLLLLFAHLCHRQYCAINCSSRYRCAKRRGKETTSLGAME